ncbi:creatininase [Oceanobacillus salinisoli]|uniref:creatininase n=1 Tax=Oceanobacillus salinisoli TaxID=2678611 RepID=UPI0012E17435|nr:creatininase [Oceanobacillus salinisoli]
MKNNLIRNMTWQEYQSKVKDHILILPIGSTEQHGPHLPLGVDAIISENYGHAIARRVKAVIAPTITYGYKSQPASGGGPLFPGTVDLNGTTLTSLVYDVLKEFIEDGWKNILLMSGHYENDAFLAEACDLLLRNQKEEYPKILLSNWWDNISPELMPKIFDEVEFKGWAMEHAAITETSMMMYFAPELVHEDLITDEGIDQPPTYQRFPPSKTFIPSSGCLYTGKSSSAEKGRLIVEDVTNNIVLFLKKEFTVVEV